jgi:hypothetical protein
LAAGIGTGEAYNTGNASIGTLEIAEANVRATGEVNGSGIRSGSGAYHAVFNPWAIVDALTIADSNVTAIAGANAAAIGSGHVWTIVHHIDLINGSFTLSSSWQGVGTDSGSITVLNGFFDCSAAAECFSASAVRIGNGSTAIVSGVQKVVSFTGWEIAEGANLCFEYLSTSTREEHLTGHTMIHLGSIFLPYPAVYALEIQKLDGEDNRK